MLSGLGGNDVLVGGADDDRLDGGAGDDTLSGGADDDSLTGGTGADTYIYGAGDGSDVINDAGDSDAAIVDTLVIDGYALADMRFSRTGAGGADITIRFAGNGDTLVIRGGFDAGSTGAIERIEISLDDTVLTHADMLALIGPDAPVAGAHIVGDATDETIMGTDGADYLEGGAGADTINGGLGDDIFGDVASDASVDTYTGGEGRDTFRFLPSAATGAAIGTDIITDFTPGDDGDIIRLAGNNPNPFDDGVLKVVQSGTDVVVLLSDPGGFDRAILRLLDTDASLLTPFNFGGQPFGLDNAINIADGDEGNVLPGSSLADTIFGNGGADTIRGEAGNDTLAGGSGGDTIDGGVGNDLIAGDQGNDTIRGGAGDDIIAGGTGDDLLIGGGDGITLSGNDVFKGGAGDDTIMGGVEDDTYHFGADDDRDTVLDAGGTDAIVFDATVSPADIAVTQDGEDLVLVVTGGSTRVRLAGAIDRDGGTRIEDIRFDDGTQWTFEHVLALSQAGTAGDDALGVVTSQLLVGPNLLVNGSFEQYDAGARFYSASWRSDTIPGWTDANGLEFQLARTGTEGVNTHDGGLWLDLEGYEGNADISQTVAGLTAGDTLLLSFDYANRANPGPEGAFEVYWNGELVFASDERHTDMRRAEVPVTAVDGDNVLRFVGLGAIDSDGASIDDVRLQQVAPQGAAELYELLGGDGNDVLTGSFTADTLEGGAGDDLLRGGGGDDTYVIAGPGTGHDRIEDTLGLNDIVLGAGQDAANIRVIRTVDTLSLLLNDFGSRLELAVGADTAHNFRVVFADGTVLGAAELEALAQRASEGDNRLWGTDDADDTIDGLGGDDRISTRGGDDDLSGGAGFDVLEGGLGDDTYRFNAGDGQDIVSDAGGAADTLVLGTGIAPADIVVEQSNDGTALILKVAGTNDRVRIENALTTGRIETVRFDDGTTWTIADLLRKLPTALDDRIYGDAGANTIEAGLGDDRIYGRGGNDTYVFNRGDGRDFISDESQSTGDVLRINGYTADEVRFVRLGTDSDDVAIRFTGTTDEIIVVDLLDAANRGIETIALGDGTTFNTAAITALLLSIQSTDGHDIIVGTNNSEIIEASKGDDLIDGRGGNDRFIFRAGDGDDRIDAFGTGNKILEFTDYSPDDIQYAVRGGPGSNDLVIVFTGTDDRVVLTDALGPLNNGGSNTLTIRWADDTIWTRADMRARAIADIDTAGDDNVEGFDSADLFEMQAGDDTVAGKGGSDTYRFGRGDGHDTIVESSTSTADTDTVYLLDFASTEATLSRLFRGSDSVEMRFEGNDDDSLTLIDALAPDGRGIENYVFADGVIWTRAQILEALANNRPVAQDDGYYTVVTGSSVTIRLSDLLRNDFDADDDPLAVVSVDGGAHGSAVLDGLGNVVYTPDAGFTGPTTLSYRIGDGRNAFADADVNVNVRPIAEAKDDTGFTVAEDDFLTIDSRRLLSNDIDGDRMIIGQVFGAVNGSVSLASDGTISFTPAPNFNGTASFTYAANTPEGGRDEAVVTIQVTPTNDAPTARDNGGFRTLEGKPFEIAAGALLGNDYDIDGDKVSILSVQSSANAQATLLANGNIRVQPVGDFFGNTYFDYTIQDPSGATSTARVSLYVEPVNTLPVANDDYFDLTQGGQPILEDNPIVINADQLFANDRDEDGDPLVLAGIRNAVGGRAQLLDNQTVLFTPKANFNGEASFEYLANDGQGGFAWAKATVLYQAVNDNPVARNDSYRSDSLYFLRGPEDVPIEIPIIELLKNDYDVEGFAVFFENATGATNGDIEITDEGTIIFTPDENYWGEATFAYTITDPEGLVHGAVVTLYFDNVSDARPDAMPDEIYVFEDIPTTIPVDALLGNDTDVDRDPLTFVYWRHLNGLADVFKFGHKAGGPLNGKLEYDVNGDLLFTPNRDATASSGFVYGVTDGVEGISEAFVDIIIIPSNDDPTVVNDTGFVSPFDIPLAINVKDLVFNDYDIEQADTDGDGIVDVDLDDPNRPRPEFVAVLSVLDPVELAQGRRVQVGSFEIVNFRGEQFLVARFDPGFSGEIVIEYVIKDEEGLLDTGFASAHVAPVYDGILSGSPFIDYLEGNSLDEIVYGYRRDDKIVALGGNDTIYADAGNDVIDAGDGDDFIDGGDGADAITGGAGFDTVSFAGSNVGVRADLESRIGQGGFAQGDTFIGVEALSGTRFRDTLGGDGQANTLFGLGGDDTLEGRGGIDTLLGGAGDDTIDGGTGGGIIDGGEGSDTASYFFSDAGVTISLVDGIADGGWATGDVLTGIENVVGTEFADSLTGDGQDNFLNGGRGDDVLVGLAGDDVLVGERGADTLLGGEGMDTADYSISATGIVIDMADGSASSGDAQGDTFDSIEIVVGSHHDDTIRGDDGDNIIRGNLGADVIDGRGGFDTADYSQADNGVVVDLGTGTGSAGEAQGDTLIGIERLVGSEWIDTLIGGTADETFDGMFGDDLIMGGKGSDTYQFGLDSGEDTITEIGDATDIDRVVLDAGIATRDVSLIRFGDDLFIELERDDGFLIDTITVTNHFTGAENGIEQIVFADGTVWDAAFIAANLRPSRFNAQNDIARFGVEDELYTIDPAVLMENDAADLTGITFVGVSNPRFGTVSVNEDGMIEFLGAKDHNGDAFFNYTVQDAFGRQSTARVEVNLSARNDAPVAVDDPLQYGVEDGILRIRIENLLANDYDVDGDAEQEGLRIVDIQPLVNINGDAIDPYRDRDYTKQGTHVAASIEGQYLEFKPRPDYFGFAGFRYTLADSSGATSTADVEIYFAPVNDAPRTRNHLRTVRLEQTTELNVTDLMKHVYDVEGDAVTFLGLVGGADENPTSNGSLVYDEATGRIDYTPARLGKGYIEFEVIDARGLSATLRYNLNVRPLNDPPEAKDDYGYRTLEDTILLIDPADLLANDTDPNDDVLTFDSISRFAVNGKVRMNDDGMIEFIPRDNFNGSATFTYTISDERGAEDTATVHITILPRNEGPVLRDDVVAGIEDLTLYAIPAETFGNDLDRDGDVIFYSFTQMLGQLEFRYLSPDFTVEALSDNNTALPEWLHFDAETMTFSGTAPADWTGPIEVAVFLRDPSNGATYPFRFKFGVGQFEAGAEPVSVEEDVMEGFAIREPFAKSFEFGADSLGTDVTVVATLADGSPLPEWLAFDADTLTFTGTPPEGAMAFDAAIVFTLAGEGDPVTFTETVAIDPATIAVGIGYDSDIALFDIASGSWNVSLASSRPLPDWLTFDYDTMTLSRSGFAPDEDAPIARVQITWVPDAEKQLDEDSWLTTTRGFTLEFVLDPADEIDPAINALLQNDPFFAAQGLFALDLGSAAGIATSRESGAPLNSWLGFDAETLEYAGMPVSEWVGAVPIRMDIAGDGSGLPTMSIITELVVDDSFTVVENKSLKLTDDGERLFLSAPEDYNGPVLIRYGAKDEKGGQSEEPAYVIFNIRPDSELPDPRGDAFELFEEGEVTFAVSELLANDRDDDGEPLRVVEIGAPGNGAITVNLATMAVDATRFVDAVPGGTWSATLADGDPLPDWMAIDAETGRLFGEIPIDVLDVFAITITSSDGTTSNSFTFNRALDGNDGASVTYNPFAAFSGTDTLVYAVTDDADGISSARVTLTVKPLFDPPIAVTDRIDGWEDTALVITPAQLLANDFDYDGDAIEFLDVRNAVGGEVTFDGTQIVFTPTPDTNGRATFEYLITDNTHGTSVGLVEVNVRNTNVAPTAVTDHFDTVEDVPFEFTIADLLANDFDADGDSFRFVSLQKQGSDSRIQELPDGRWQFVPEENVYGLQTFRYTITDGRKSQTGIIEFDIAAVNDAPIANQDGIYFGEQDTPLYIDLSELLINDRDVEGDAFTLVEIFDGDNGTVVREGDFAVFTGREGYFGDGGFHYRVTDEHGATSVGFVEIIVMPEFDLPIAVSDAGFEVLEDGYIDIDPAYLMLNDYVPEETIPTFLGLVGKGVTLLDNGLYRFTPDADFFGTVKLTYAITNESGFAVPTTVTIQVLPTPDNPVARDDAFATVEDTPLTVFVTDILANDYDVDRQAVVINRFTAAHGVSVEDNGIGQIVITPDANFIGEGWFEYEVKDSTGRTDVARVTVSVSAVNDAPIIGAVPVFQGVEDTPFAFTLPRSLVTDADGDAMVLELRSPGGAALPDWIDYNQATGAITGTPPANLNGEIVLEFAAFDGEVESVKTLTILLAPVNDAPVEGAAMADATAYADEAFVLPVPEGTFVDVDGDALTLTATLVGGDPLPAWLSFDGTRFTGVAPEGIDASFAIELTADDGVAQATSRFTIHAIDANDAPLPANDGPIAFTGDTFRIDPADLLANDSDPDGDPLVLVSVQGATAGELSVDADGFIVLDRLITFGGLASFTYTVTDGQEESTATVTLNVTNRFAGFGEGTDGPDDVIGNDTNQLLFYGRDGNDRLFGGARPDRLAGGDGDDVLRGRDGRDWFWGGEGDDLIHGDQHVDTAFYDGDYADFSFTVSANGFLYVTDNNAADGDEGTDKLANVEFLQFGDGTVVDTKVLYPAKPKLEIPLPDLTVKEGQPVSVTLPDGMFTDRNGDEITYLARVRNQPFPSWLSFDGKTLSGIAPDGFDGALTVRIYASDGGPRMGWDEFILTVEAVPPVAQDDGAFLSYDEVFSIPLADLLANDFDPDGDTLSVTAVGAGAHASAVIDGDRLVVTGQAGFRGNDVLTYTLSDGHWTDTASIAIRIADDPLAGFTAGTDGADVLVGDLATVNTIDGRGGADDIYGGNLADKLAGGAGDDIVRGRDGNDLLWGNAGNDVLNGGNGVDTARFAGLASEYALDLSGTRPVVTDTRPGSYGDDGQDSLIGVERLFFEAEGATISLVAPIVLDLDGDGIATTTLADSTAAFDFDGDGVADRTAWIGAGDAFLFLDRDGDGTVSGAAELSFTADAPGALTDLAGLRSFDSNGDGVFDALDERFGDFGVWRDANSDGVVDAGETLSLADVGIASIDLAGRPSDAGNGLNGVTVVQEGSFTLEDGTQQTFFDAVLSFTPSAAAGEAAQAGDAPLGDFQSLELGRGLIARAMSRFVRFDDLQIDASTGSRGLWEKGEESGDSVTTGTGLFMDDNFG